MAMPTGDRCFDETIRYQLATGRNNATRGIVHARESLDNDDPMIRINIARHWQS